MAKRLMDTNIDDKQWFVELTPTEKCFWWYVCLKCDHAGIWEVNFKKAGFLINDKLDEKRLRELFRDKYIEIDDGKRWYITGFIEFQYRCKVKDLNSQNMAHLGVIRRLKEKGLYKGLCRGLKGSKDKEQVQVQEKDKEQDKEEITKETRSKIDRLIEKLKGKKNV